MNVPCESIRGYIQDVEPSFVNAADTYKISFNMQKNFPEMKQQMLQNQWVAATYSISKKIICISFQRYCSYTNYQIAPVNGVTSLATSNAELYINIVFIRLPINSFNLFLIPEYTIVCVNTYIYIN